MNASPPPGPISPKLAASLAAKFPAHDWSAVEEAGAAGPAAVPTLAGYLGSPDHLQRVLAVDAIIAAGGPEAPGLLLRAAQTDLNTQVRINAANALRAHPAPTDDLLDALDRAADPYVRARVTLALGDKDAAAEPRVPGELNTRLRMADRTGLQTELTHPTELTDATVAALGRLGDPKARQRFGEMLAAARGTRIKELIDLCGYIDQAWLVPALRPVLDRDETAHDVSNHIATHLRRGKDLAVDEVGRLTRQAFSFPTASKVNYDPAEVAEVARFVDGFRP